MITMADLQKRFRARVQAAKLAVDKTEADNGASARKHSKKIYVLGHRDRGERWAGQPYTTTIDTRYRRIAPRQSM